MKRKTVKRIFLFFIFFLPLQYAAVGIVGVLKSEPWPALVLPAFKSVYERQDTILLKNAQFYLVRQGNRNVVPVKSSVLFSGINRSQRFRFIEIHFSSPSGALTGEAVEWLEKQTRQLFPGAAVRGIRVKWQWEYYSFSGSQKTLDSIATVRSYFISFDDE